MDRQSSSRNGDAARDLPEAVRIRRDVTDFLTAHLQR
ncbi:hypothetical protein ABIA33_004216 [Streptacidiphilus sp. MAP12-16]